MTIEVTLVTGDFDECIYEDGVRTFSSKNAITLHDFIFYLALDKTSSCNFTIVKYTNDWFLSVNDFPKYLKDVKVKHET